jgi:HK97 family phage major capsid protein
MKGYIHKTDAARQLGITSRDIEALIEQRTLLPNGDSVSIASVERYAATQPHRFGELAQACARSHGWGEHAALRRLLGAAALAASTEGAGADGGFAVPTAYADAILAPFFSGTNLPALCHRIVTSTNNYAVPADRKPPYDQSSGIRVAFVGETAPITQSKPKLEIVSAKLKKLAALVPVSEELLQDAPSLGAYVEMAAAESIAYVATEKIVWGSGVGEPLGFMNSPCLITVAGENGQAPGTINGVNIAKMHARMPANSLSSALWLVHPDAVSQLIGLSINSQIVYVAGDELAPAGRLLGRPIVPHEACAALGSPGDIMFIDPKQYLLPVREPNLVTNTSLHMWFDQSLVAFKFRFRFDGLPAWAAPVVSRVGGALRSPFVALGERN